MRYNSPNSFIRVRAIALVDEMTIAEYHEWQDTGKLPKRLRGATRMETLTTIADAEPSLVEAAADAMNRNKYGAIKTEVDGVTFDSKKEARRYTELKAFEAAGAISDLVLQPRFLFEHNGVRISSYKPDFQYVDTDTGETIIEDVKGGKATRTQAYVMRRKMMKAFHGIDVREV